MNESGPVFQPPVGEPISNMPIDPNATPAPQAAPTEMGALSSFAPVAEVAQRMVVDAAPTSPTPGEPGSRENPVIVDNDGFKGDPRRVLGHPSNPMSSVNMSEAFGASRAQEKPDDRPLEPGAITEVPKV